MNIREASKNDINRHTGISSLICSCGLVHDDEIKTDAEARKEILRLLGSKCSNLNCRWMNEDSSIGCTDVRLLQVDHIEDDGYLDKKNGFKWTRRLKLILKGSKRFQLLCANCNWMKRSTSGAWSLEFELWNRKQRARNVQSI